MTAIKALDLNFKCPYHANVIKTFEIKSKIIGKTILTTEIFIKNILEQKNFYCKIFRWYNFDAKSERRRSIKCLMKE